MPPLIASLDRGQEKEYTENRKKMIVNLTQSVKCSHCVFNIGLWMDGRYFIGLCPIVFQLTGKQRVNS